MKKVSILLLNLFISVLAFAQIPEVENNNTFGLANPINRYEVKSATVNNTTDELDYFRAVIPEDDTLKIYVQATCTGASGTGWLYLNGYDHRKTSSIFGDHVANNTSVARGATVNGTYNVYGMAADNVLNKETFKNPGSVTITNNSCLGGLLTFTSNKDGSTYQWQVNTGSGYGKNGSECYGFEIAVIIRTTFIQRTKVPCYNMGHLYEALSDEDGV